MQKGAVLRGFQMILQRAAKRQCKAFRHFQGEPGAYFSKLVALSLG
jgi:hypothetical protein